MNEQKRFLKFNMHFLQFKFNFLSFTAAFLYHVEKLKKVLLKLHSFFLCVDISEITCVVKLLYPDRKGNFTCLDLLHLSLNCLFVVILSPADGAVSSALMLHATHHTKGHSEMLHLANALALLNVKYQTTHLYDELGNIQMQ